jgi:regulator of ribosome biosynthesis
MHVAKKATASLGKFQAKLPKEKPLKGTGKKRKFDPLVIDSNKEKSKNLEVLSKVMSKKPKIDIDKAVKHVDIRDME